MWIVDTQSYVKYRRKYYRCWCTMQMEKHCGWLPYTQNAAHMRFSIFTLKTQFKFCHRREKPNFISMLITLFMCANAFRFRSNWTADISINIITCDDLELLKNRCAHEIWLVVSYMHQKCCVCVCACLHLSLFYRVLGVVCKIHSDVPLRLA